MKDQTKPIEDSYWVLPGRFIAGEYPGALNEREARIKLRWLLERGITFFLDLTEVGESGLKPYNALLKEEAARLGCLVIHQRFPIQDMHTPAKGEMVAVLEILNAALKENHNIYLHCFGGVGRTGTVVGCFLVRHGLDGAQAITQIAEWRRHTPDGWKPSPETAEQRRFVLNWRG